MRDIFLCPDCGPQEKMLFDASVLMDRAFEGVYFEVVKLEPTGFSVIAQLSDLGYLEDFNMPKFLKEATEQVLDDCELTCPSCMEPIE